MRRRWDVITAICLFFCFHIFPLLTQTSPYRVPDLITSTIDDQVRVVGNRHPLARPEYTQTRMGRAEEPIA